MNDRFGSICVWHLIVLSGNPDSTLYKKCFFQKLDAPLDFG
ncbi:MULTISPECIES: hypothetical protein [Microcoleaceae]|nr:hypothetical protein [Tychonema sp. LEGE 06208]